LPLADLLHSQKQGVNTKKHERPESAKEVAMRLHYIQHVPFEGPANIESWAKEQNWEISCTHLYRGDKLPSPEQLDWLVVMGGPMNVYEEDVYPWLDSEKKLIRECVEKNKIVLGICLGAQLIADVLGGRVVRNLHKEIGWFPVNLLPPGPSSIPFGGLPEEFVALHWHGDTFSLPPGSIMLAESEACQAQAFSHNSGRVLGLQFHLESSVESVRSLIQNCSDELVEGKYIQTADAILEPRENFSNIQKTLRHLLENMKAGF
jgi:GMP synthase-like glutamine amidotransferase